MISKWPQHNILVKRDLSSIKVADFGLARILSAPGQPLTHDVVTLWYRSPELLLGECCYDESIDIWSLGCIAVELLRGEVLFRGDSEIDMLFRIFRVVGLPKADEWPRLPFEKRSIFPQMSGDISLLHVQGPALDLIASMLSTDPKKRPSCLECLCHPWLMS